MAKGAPAGICRRWHLDCAVARGLREVIGDHKAVREARENIPLELKLNQSQLAREAIAASPRLISYL
jgi:hypothetical protein